MSKKERSIVILLGVRVDSTPESSLLKRVEGWIEDYKVGDDGKRLIFTPNPEMLVDASVDKGFLKVLNSSDINIADGVGLQWASRLLSLFGTIKNNQTISNRVTGVDFSRKLVGLAAKNGWRVYLLGGGPNVASRAARRLRAEYGQAAVKGFEIKADEGPGLNQDGQSWLRASEETVKKVSAYGPEILLVAFGHKKQERWLVENMDKMQFGVAMGVGGTLDYLSGRVKRAPEWLRGVGLEWLFRLMVEPRRWRRIVKAVLIFPWMVIKESVGGR